ncbi:hypothetical protein X777_07943 [Ooceraea biroi]|uniref:Uncharacterized protein n=1 Tax=Ooceraea biroi TaxID=2015173 RepID=A0A026X005_OOCBI|nr:hypothetical protein X777_07943 [Ooceraea biroi]
MSLSQDSTQKMMDVIWTLLIQLTVQKALVENLNLETHCHVRMHLVHPQRQIVHHQKMDSDEENGASGAGDKCLESCNNKSESDETLCAQDLSMELTAVIPTCLLSSRSCTEEGKNVCRINNTVCNTSMEMTAAIPSRTRSRSIPSHSSNKNVIGKSDLRKDQTDNTEFSNNVLTVMTKPAINIIPPTPSSIYSKETPSADGLRDDDKTIFFHNVSVDITKTVSLKNRQENTDMIISKSSSKETSHKGKDTNDTTCFNERTKLLHRSMELTEAVPVSSYRERTRNIAHSQSIQENTHEKNKIDGTEYFNNLPMEMTRICDKENLRKNDSTVGDNRTMVFHNVSMDMTKTVSSKNRQENTDMIISKSSSKETSHKGKDTNDTTCFNERTKLLHRSMELTEAVPVSSYRERTPITTLPCHDKTLSTIAQSSSQTMSKTYFPAESSTELVLQNDADTNKTVQNISMEITAAVPSTSHLTQDVAANQINNLLIFESSEFQNATTNNAAESRKSLTEGNFKVLKEIRVETADACNKLSNNAAVASSSSNLDHSANTTAKIVAGVKRVSESEKSSPKKIRISYAESQSSRENNVHSSHESNDSVRNIGCGEHLTENTINLAQISESNLRDGSNKISERSFIRKKSSMELIFQNDADTNKNISMEIPPSFDFDSEKENSFLGICEDQLGTSTIVNPLLNKPEDNSSDRLTNITESECSAESRKEQDQDEHFTISKEKEESINTINIENDQTECCSKNILTHQQDGYEEDQETDWQTITRVATTIIDNSRNDESSCCAIEEHNRKSVLSTCVDHLNISTIKRKTITEDPLDPEEHCRENLNDGVKVQTMEWKEEKSADGGLETEQCISTIEDDRDPFLSLSQKLETHAESDDCIWNVHHKNADRKIIVLGFMANSLLVATFLSDDNLNCSGEGSLKEIKAVSLVADSSDVFVKLVHKLILEKVNTQILTHRYRSQEDVFPMLDFVTQEVKLAMDFMFDLKRLEVYHLMEITCDEIEFAVRSKQMDIILKVAVKVKRFDKLTSSDVSVRCLLGSTLINESEVKYLIKNVKKDCKFLKRYMNDIKDYIDIMEEISK